MFSSKRISELENRMSKLESRQFAFLEHAQRVLETVVGNDKKRFMYEMQQEDIELVEDGKKLRKIRKMIL